MTDAYTAFRETEPCHRCGDGESWTVKGPDGACIGQSWTGDNAECEAEEEAQALNAAYEHGRASLMDLLRQAHAWISEDTEALQASHMPYNDTDPIDIEVRAEVDARRAWLAAFQSTSKAEDA